MRKSCVSTESSNFRILMVPSSRNLRSASALLALNSARERAYSAAVCILNDLAVASVEALPHVLVDAERNTGPRLLKPRIVVVACDVVNPHDHVEPRPDPFAGVDGAGLERLHDFTAGHVHHDGRLSAAGHLRRGRASGGAAP